MGEVCQVCGISLFRHERAEGCCLGCLFGALDRFMGLLELGGRFNYRVPIARTRPRA